MLILLNLRLMIRGGQNVNVYSYLYSRYVEMSRFDVAYMYDIARIQLR